MCGICGYVGPIVPGLLARMAQRIRHRGPDAEGVLEHESIHLASRRLRVVDVEGGDQPIFNEDRSIGVVFNGELYNHRALRAELEREGHVFSTRSDTEVLVHLYEQDGVGFPRRLNGMFAFALYDYGRRRLLLGRDQIGIKPLLLWQSGERLAFASEAKSLLCHPDISPELDPEALHLLLNVRFVPGPRTMFRGIRQLPPGHLLILERGAPTLQKYHDLQPSSSSPMPPEEAAERFFAVLEDAVDRQLVADVPVGIYLSGGLDSSAIVAAAAEHRRKTGDQARLSTFALGFNESTDELDDASLVARKFATDHHQLRVSARPLLELPHAVWHTEQPKVNAVQGFVLARFARERVTVALSGLGGDELFLGYDIYRHLATVMEGGSARLARLGARPARAIASRLAGLGALRAENFRRAFELVGAAKDPLGAWLTLRNGWDHGSSRLAGRIYREEFRVRLGTSCKQAFAPYFDRPDLHAIEQIQMAELRSKLVDDFLLNEDRTSMASSLEVRVPLLDLEVVNFALSLPFSTRFEGERNKPVMKRALAPRLPPEILAKRKWGFTFNPHELWRASLRDHVAQELSPKYLAGQEIVRPEFVREILEARPSSLLRWHYFMVWQLLGLKLWTEIFVEGLEPEAIAERLGA
jgi:asparagine synthase (glutamine-hydrolysing)